MELHQVGTFSDYHYDGGYGSGVCIGGGQRNVELLPEQCVGIYMNGNTMWSGTTEVSAGVYWGSQYGY